MSDDNQKVVLIIGMPNSGKSHSLQNLPMKEVAYLNCDLSRLPFPCKGIHDLKIKRAASIGKYIKKSEDNDKIKYIVLDTLTSLMDMYERQVVLTVEKSKTMQAWSDYSKLFGDTAQNLKSGTKHTIVLSHLVCEYNETTLAFTNKIPIKGGQGKKGAEHQFAFIVEARMVSIKDLDGFENPWLNITEDEKFFGKKRVFQTLPYKEDGLLCRTPAGMFGRKSVFIDNDCKVLMDIIDDFYKEA